MSHYVILLGSLRAESTNRQLAEAFAGTLPAGDSATVFEELREVPFYDEDRDVTGQEPGPAGRLRAAVAAADAVVIVTPEHNHTAPAVIINAIEWLARPRGKSALLRKPVLMLGATPGPRAVAGAIAVLREALAAAHADVVGTDYTWGDVYHVLDGRHPAEVDEVVGVLHKARTELEELVADRPEAAPE
ncbi:NAD(P)H-dependent oxidoreductase [Corynebacterium sphenisci]|uniref:NAD(P)H-dependent oxidoreductase n=1 Tax=Corynebacterium sphenisci TaxID=191493 RepID=UPI0026DF6BCF|nr:NADPH-dependent FMN reductase [Corynebacterium sphenisci]MDO5730404.1 NADPH-dependent FMN reductase [Corynebacterium sphenisci]